MFKTIVALVCVSSVLFGNTYSLELFKKRTDQVGNYINSEEKTVARTKSATHLVVDLLFNYQSESNDEIKTEKEYLFKELMKDFSSEYGIDFQEIDASYTPIGNRFEDLNIELNPLRTDNKALYLFTAAGILLVGVAGTVGTMFLVGSTLLFSEAGVITMALIFDGAYLGSLSGWAATHQQSSNETIVELRYMKQQEFTKAMQKVFVKAMHDIEL